MKRLLLILTIAISALYPQNITVDNDKDFDKALSLYNSKKYSDALDLFKKIESRTDNNTKNSVSGFFVSKILIEQKKYTEAEKSANNFLLKYPNSKYADEVKNLLIKNYVVQSDYNKAFESCINFLESSNSIVFKKETKSIAEKIALNNLKSSEVEKLVGKNPALTSFLLLLTGKLYLAEGDNADALKKFSEITSKHITSDEYVEALNLKKNYSSLQSNSTYPIVGVLLSLTDENGREIDAAKEILEGIKYAFHEYNSDHSEKIGIVISDIQRDKTKITEAANNFIENNDAVFVKTLQ